MTGYYDAVLGLIPVLFAGVTGALLLTGVALVFSIAAGATVAGSLIAHAMFVRTPTDAPAVSVPSTGPVNAD